MCGIFAYLNYNVERERRYILEVLFNGLRRLEYRGYDSAGISIDSDPSRLSVEVGGRCACGSSPSLVFRQEGKIESLVRSVYEEFAEVTNKEEESSKEEEGTRGILPFWIKGNPAYKWIPGIMYGWILGILNPVNKHKK